MIFREKIFMEGLPIWVLKVLSFEGFVMNLFTVFSSKKITASLRIKKPELIFLILLYLHERF